MSDKKRVAELEHDDDSQDEREEKKKTMVIDVPDIDDEAPREVAKTPQKQGFFSRLFGGGKKQKKAGKGSAPTDSEVSHSHPTNDDDADADAQKPLVSEEQQQQQGDHDGDQQPDQAGHDHDSSHGPADGGFTSTAKVYPNRSRNTTLFWLFYTTALVILVSLGYTMERPIAALLVIATFVVSLGITRVLTRSMTNLFDQDPPIEVMNVAFTIGVVGGVSAGLLGILLARLLDMGFKPNSNEDVDFTKLFFLITLDSLFFRALVLELAKFFMCQLATSNRYRPYLAGPYAVVIFCVSVSLGVAAACGTFYVLRDRNMLNSEGNWNTVVLHSLLYIVLHLTTGLIYGNAFARRHFLFDKKQTWPRVLAAPILLHALYRWILDWNFRDGNWDEMIKSHRFMRESNTEDIGNWYELLQVFLMAVLTAGLYFSWGGVTATSRQFQRRATQQHQQ